VSTRLVDEQPPHVVEVLDRISPLCKDRGAREWADPVDDDPERLAAGVVVDRRDGG
jgi:hypothetical protein